MEITSAAIHMVLPFFTVLSLSGSPVVLYRRMPITPNAMPNAGIRKEHSSAAIPSPGPVGFRNFPIAPVPVVPKSMGA